MRPPGTWPWARPRWPPGTWPRPTGWAAARGRRPAAELIGVAYAVAGLALSALVVRDTAAHVAAETAAQPDPGQETATTQHGPAQDTATTRSGLGSDTAPARPGPASGASIAAPRPFGMIFLDTSWRNVSLRGASQAGLVNNLNDGLTWGVF